MSEPYSTQPGPRSRNVPLLVVLCAIGVLLLAIVVLLAFILFSPSTVTASAPVTATPSSTVTSAPTATPRATSSSTESSGAASGVDSGTDSGTNSGGGSGAGGSDGGGSSAGGSGESAPSPTPTEVKKPLMQVFNTHGVQVVCVTGTDAVPAQLNFDLSFDYSARDTTAVYIGVDTDDPVANPFEGPLPATGSVVVPFSCYGPHTYSFAAVGADGSRDDGSVTFVNKGDPDPSAK
ncbi:hypothetical protein [Subtercola endophyticus]|uniref:hypothetical protein n=1 Tax=Subtercola endophyticus TaxID=2895559 RepID=UPI001E576355|nr:hypothetical protein [Subtercola endophyticus]UFS60180.1 hypothetical protein LQ955_05320 [Subtercola endophyticus]